MSRLRDPDVRSRTEVWFVGQRGHYLARLNPETGEFVRRDLADAAGPYSLAVGADGIVISPDGAPWIALFGTNKLVSIDPKSLKLVEYALPDVGARPRRIGASCDGRIYHTDYARGYLGRSDPKTRTVEEWAVPLDHGARPYAMAVDARDRVWFVETVPSSNTLAGFLAPDRDFLFGNADLLGRARDAAHGLLRRDADGLVRDRRDYHRPRQAGRVRTKALAASAISRRRPHSAGHGPASVDSGAGRGYGRAPRWHGPDTHHLAATVAEACHAAKVAMKVRNSLKTAKKRHAACRVVRRNRRVYVINKVNRRFKARQG